MSSRNEQDRNEVIARVCHEAISAYRRGLGEPALPAWEDAPSWQIEATHAAIRFRLENPDAPPSAQHDQWMADKRANGWLFGAEKDSEAKTHPMLKPYGELPESERRKDALIQAVINALITPI